MPDPNLFRVNGTIYSSTSGSHSFNGLPYKGVKAATFEEDRERKIVHAAQQDGTPLGMTSGLYKVSNVSFTLLRDTAHALLTELTVLGLGSFGDASFTYMLRLFEPIVPGETPSVPTITTISGCRISKVTEKIEVGTEELVTELSCQAMFIQRLVGGIPVQLWSKIRALVP